MKKETQSIIQNLENTLSGEPWSGRAVYDLLNDTDETKVYVKPGGTEHSLIEVLYHMITWAGFTLSRIDGNSAGTLAAAEEMDWREINPISVRRFKSITFQSISPNAWSSIRELFQFGWVPMR